MSGWKAKRFWTTVEVVPEGAGFAITLDGRPVRTPAKAPLLLPTVAMAHAVAAEWAAQEGEVNPAAMPCTRSANAAIDKVAPQFDEVAALIAAYGETDLLCYRAEAPAALAARQAAAWDPLLDWAGGALAAPLARTAGVVPCAQDPGALARLGAAVRAQTPFQLAALHDLVAISGSLVLGLAVIAGRLTAEGAWAASRIDEAWQTEQWGEDAEAVAAETLRHRDFLHAARFHGLASAAA